MSQNEVCYSNLEILIRLSQNDDFKKACIMDSSFRDLLSNLIKKQANNLDKSESIEEDFPSAPSSADNDFSVSSCFAMIGDSNLLPFEKAQKNMQLMRYLDKNIEELNLSVRAYNCLKRINVNSIRDFLNLSPNRIKNIHNLGNRGAEELIKQKEKLYKSFIKDILE